jgi:Flp pilus assembly protein TadG
MRADERGQVTAFVALITLSLLLVVGLVLDGGFILATKRQVDNEAAAAARAGAQEVSTEVLRASGRSELDERRAEAAALDYLAAIGRTGTATAIGDTVTVEVTASRSLLILGVAGLRDVTVTGSGRARAARGVTEAEPSVP